MSLVSTAPDAVQRPDRVATHLVEAGAPPTYLGIEREDLEQHFLRLTGTDRP
jgi:ABC-2 type transport system ATP-binding protein